MGTEILVLAFLLLVPFASLLEAPHLPSLGSYESSGKPIRVASLMGSTSLPKIETKPLFWAFALPLHSHFQLLHDLGSPKSNDTKK